MIVEGQVHGGLADGIGMALMQVIAFDEDGNCLGASFMDYLLPTSMECPSWELGETVTPSPHHPIGAKGVGESATVGSPPAVVNAVIDALAPYGVRHADMPLTPANVWRAIQGRPLRTDLAITVTPVPTCCAGRTGCAPSARRSSSPRSSGRSGRPARRPATARIVLPDGTIEGFVGGDLRRVDRAASQGLRLLETGESTLLRITPDGRVPRRPSRPEGLVVGRQPVPVRRHAGDLPGGGAAADAGPRLRRRADRPRAGERRRGGRLRRSRPPPTRRRRSPPDARARRGRLARPRRGAGARRRAARRRAVRRAGGQPAAGRRGASPSWTSRTSCGRGCTPRPGWTSAPAPPARSRCRSCAEVIAGAAARQPTPPAQLPDARAPSAAGGRHGGDRPGLRHDRRRSPDAACSWSTTAATWYFCGARLPQGLRRRPGTVRRS